MCHLKKKIDQATVSTMNLVPQKLRNQSWTAIIQMVAWFLKIETEENDGNRYCLSIYLTFYLSIYLFLLGRRKDAFPHDVWDSDIMVFSTIQYSLKLILFSSCQNWTACALLILLYLLSLAFVCKIVRIPWYAFLHVFSDARRLVIMFFSTKFKPIWLT